MFKQKQSIAQTQEVSFMPDGTLEYSFLLAQPGPLPGKWARFFRWLFEKTGRRIKWLGPLGYKNPHMVDIFEKIKAGKYNGYSVGYSVLGADSAGKVERKK